MGIVRGSIMLSLEYFLAVELICISACEILEFGR